MTPHSLEVENAAEGIHSKAKVPLPPGLGRRDIDMSASSAKDLTKVISGWTVEKSDRIADITWS
jgi:hypothetical protein